MYSKVCAGGKKETETNNGNLKLKGGTAELRIETGRWIGLKREDRHFNTACT